jgi:hypothetical protein
MAVSLRIRKLAAWIAIPLLGIGGGLLLMKMRTDAVESGKCIDCQNRLKLLGIHLKNFIQVYGSLPPAYLCDQSGKPVNSWRMLMVPNWQYHWHSWKYDLTQRWDSSKNADLPLETMKMREFQCPSMEENQKPAITNYVAVVGPNTMWPGEKSAKPAADGSDNDKILLIEITNSDIQWMEPRDLTLEQALDALQPEKGLGIGSTHPAGINYLTVGGEVRTLNRTLNRESLRKLFVRESPEVVDPPKINPAKKWEG